MIYPLLSCRCRACGAVEISLVAVAEAGQTDQLEAVSPSYCNITGTCDGRRFGVQPFSRTAGRTSSMIAADRVHRPQASYYRRGTGTASGESR